MLSQKHLSKNRCAYIVEAAVEYFISILITDAFLATLITKTGVSDAATGIIIQLASFSFVAQLFSLFVNKRKGIKKWVTLLHLANQIMFVLLYIIPAVNLPQTAKVALFVIMFLGGHILAGIVSPYKISWLMSFVDNKSRGKFTANKEIVSLIGGMIFSFVMGSVSDHFKSCGKENIGFVICGITIFVLALIHLVSLIIVKEDKDEVEAAETKISAIQSIKSTFSNKSFLKIVLLTIIWHVATGLTISFYGTYKIHELGFSLTGVAVLGVLYAVLRSAVSRAFGRFADKNSWAKLLLVSFSIAALAFFINIFTEPTVWGISFDIAGENVTINGGQIMFALHYSIYGIAYAGINGGLTNVVFDYVPTENRSAALGVNNSLAGFTAFFSSLIGSSILAHIQGEGNKFFSFEVYGQQVLSAISFVVCIVLVIYIKKVVLNLKRIK